MVEGIVIDHLALGVDDADADVAERGKAVKVDLFHGLSFGQAVGDVEVDQLQLRVEFRGLELLFTTVLEDDHAPDEQQRVAQ